MTNHNPVAQPLFSGIDNLAIMEYAKHYNAFLLKIIHKHLPISAETVIDFGAGMGEFALSIRNSVDEVWCVENDPYLKSVIGERRLIVQDSLTQIADSSADYIYSLNVLEHIKNDASVLEDMNRVLKPNGALLIYVPAFMTLYSDMDRKVGHERRYSRTELLSKVRSAGFAVTRCQFVDSIGYFASLYLKSRKNSGVLNPKLVSFYDRYLFRLSCYFDQLCRYYFGKNLLLVAVKPNNSAI